MEIVKEQIDQLNAKLKINLKEEDVNPKVESTLADYRKKAQLKGFRPGKVPMGLIKKMYGKAVLFDEVNKTISETLNKYIIDEKLEIIGEPIPSENQETIDFDSQKDFNFNFDLGFRPQFEVPLNKKTKCTYYDIIVDDEMINKYIDAHASRYGKIETIEEAGSLSYVKGTIEQTDAEGNPLENGIRKEDTSIAITQIKDEETKNKFIGSKRDDVLKIELRKTFNSDSEIAMALGIEKEQAENLSSDFTYTIKEITEYKKGDLNEELFEKVFPGEEVKTEETFREKIKENIKNQSIKDSDYRFLLDARNLLIDKIKIELPEEFLKRWLKLRDEKNELTDEKLEKDFPMFMKDLKWQLITSKIVKDNDLKVEPEEIKQLAIDLTEAQFQQYYGLPIGSFPKDQLEKYAIDLFLKKETEVKKLYDKKFEDKVVEVIKESIKLEPKEISVEDFNKLFEEK
ncbi:MAG: trigger factor [Bacteroidales bacterium]